MSLGLTEWASLCLLSIMNYYIKVFYYCRVSDSKLKKDITFVFRYKQVYVSTNEGAISIPKKIKSQI